MTTKVRSDGKKINRKLDADMVAIIKALYLRGIPNTLIKLCYNTSEGTSFMLGNGYRQADIPPANEKTAIADLHRRFKLLITDTDTITA